METELVRCGLAPSLVTPLNLNPLKTLSKRCPTLVQHLRHSEQNLILHGPTLVEVQNHKGAQRKGRWNSWVEVERGVSCGVGLGEFYFSITVLAFNCYENRIIKIKRWTSCILLCNDTLVLSRVINPTHPHPPLKSPNFIRSQAVAMLSSAHCVSETLFFARNPFKPAAQLLRRCLEHPEWMKKWYFKKPFSNYVYQIDTTL